VMVIRPRSKVGEVTISARDISSQYIPRISYYRTCNTHSMLISSAAAQSTAFDGHDSAWTEASIGTMRTTPDLTREIALRKALGRCRKARLSLHELRSAA
jgi:hypothetical protein